MFSDVGGHILTLKSYSIWYYSIQHPRVFCLFDLMVNGYYETL